MRQLLYALILPFLFFACTEYNDDPGPSETDGLAEGDFSGGGQGSGNGEIQPGQITAGEWNDLQNWDFWNDLMQTQDFAKMHEYWKYNLSGRISVFLTTANDQPLPNSTVELVDSHGETLWATLADNRGWAELWAPAGIADPENQLKLRVNGQLHACTFYYEGTNHIVAKPAGDFPGKKIEVAFVVDATGSMGDELEYLKVELVDVISKVKDQNPDAVVNLGSVFYRDQGDEYVTRVSPFSTDIEKTIDFIKAQQASGGGDFPEAVHTALQKAVNELQWSSTALSRVIFLLLDAPPHYEDQIVSEIHDLVKKSSLNGIKIIPITASGIDKETEFLMRYMAISTNGTYVFITNDSGIGNDHLEPSVGEYDVEFLNNLIVRLINQYLQ